MAGWLRRFKRLSIRRRALADFFPDREFHYRTRGQVRYFVLSSRAQFGLCAIFAVAVSWSIFATFYFVSFDGVLQEKNRELAMARRSERELMGEVLRFNSRFRELTANIAKSRAELLKVAGRAEDWPKGTIPENMTPAERQKIAQSMAAFKALSQSWQDLNSKSERLETELKALAGEVEVSLAEQTRLRVDRDRLTTELREMREQLMAARATNTKLLGDIEQGKFFKKERDAFSARIRTLDDEVQALRSTNSRMRQRAEARTDDDRRMRRDRDALAGRVRALEDELTAMRASQERLVENLFDRSKKGVAELERVVAMTGLDIDRMIGNPNAKGGPSREIKYTDDETLNERVADLRRRLEHWQILQTAVKNLPLVQPLTGYRISSGFGGRRDPFTGRWTSHNGIDMAIAAGTPIHATGPGTVEFTGWAGGYGWMVEINHGMGVRTRYGHMQQITIEKGAKVKVGDKVGLVGSSGRSSGPHLHYEILIDGKAVDPTNFLTAGRYVLKR
ncbi:MAG: peptidoglycan DD-metalloendopeptidase family protein [Rhodospirillaceae bacterium]|nr:peptidoglycan DD-metalloendopeptidase family protein [Rhodospirillaceae bacterium]